jgi:hypothetical protein
MRAFNLYAYIHACIIYKLNAQNFKYLYINILNIGHSHFSVIALQKKRVIFFDSNKCNFLKHSKLVKFSQITLLNVNAQNEKIIFCLKIFKFNLKLWIFKKEKN